MEEKSLDEKVEIDEYSGKDLLRDISSTGFYIGMGAAACFGGGYLYGEGNLETARHAAEYGALLFGLVEGIYGIPSNIFSYVKGKVQKTRLGGKVVEAVDMIDPEDDDLDDDISEEEPETNNNKLTLEGCLNSAVTFGIGLPIAAFVADFSSDITESFIGFNPIEYGMYLIHQGYEMIPGLEEFAEEPEKINIGKGNFGLLASAGATYGVLREAYMSVKPKIPFVKEFGNPTVEL